jgi:hypothetical protein
MAEMLKARLERHFVACSAVAAAAAVSGTTQTAEASIVYSGVINVPIPNTFAGIYLNAGTGSVSPGPGSSAPGWDINPYYNAGALNFYGNPNGAAGGATDTRYVVSGADAVNLILGTLISGGSTFNTGLPFSTATGVNFLAGTDSILGFRFFNEGDSSVHYAWARIHNNAGGSGVLVDYAWENAVGAGIQAGAVPAPGALALLALGGLGLKARRRK